MLILWYPAIIRQRWLALSMLTMRWNNDEGNFYDFMIMYLAFLMCTRGVFFKEGPYSSTACWLHVCLTRKIQSTKDHVLIYQVYKQRCFLIITGLFLFSYYSPETTCLRLKIWHLELPNTTCCEIGVTISDKSGFEGSSPWCNCVWIDAISQFHPSVFSHLSFFSVSSFRPLPFPPFYLSFFAAEIGRVVIGVLTVETHQLR